MHLLDRHPVFIGPLLHNPLHNNNLNLMYPQEGEGQSGLFALIQHNPIQEIFKLTK